MMKKYAFGVDIGGTTVKIGLFLTEGRMEDSWEIPTRTEDGGRRILGDIAASMEGKLQEKNITKTEIEGIGIDVPGPVLEGRIVNKCANLGWGVLDVAEKTAELTGIAKVKVANDADAATLGEMWQGGGKNHKDLVMITLGTGVGGGIVHDGKIISGRFGAAGEIGHMRVNREETQTCGCGKCGHLEQYASATGIARKAQAMLVQSDRPSMLRNVPYLSAKEVFDCAKKGDELSLEIVEFIGEELGNACSLIACVFDPEIFVIGGGVSKAGDILIETVQRHYRQYAFHASADAEFALAALGNDAGMYGAVKMVLD
jgi:glucokinase